MKLGGAGLIVGAVALAVLLVLGITLSTGIPLYTVHESLVSNPSTPYRPNSWYAISFNNTQGATIARLEFLMPSGTLPSSNNSLAVMVAVWHIDGTWLDSLKLVFSTLNNNIGPDVWIDTPEGAQSSIILVYKDHGNSIVNIPDMGFMGSGSVTFNMLLQLPRPTPITLDYPLTVQAEMSLHESNNVFGTAGYAHTTGYPIFRRGFDGQVFLAFLIDPNGNIAKYNVGYI